jgi:uncharacterized hydrophobic protein (TIGR00271 family)
MNIWRQPLRRLIFFVFAFRERIDHKAVMQDVEADVSMVGSRVWVLMAAIIIASVGLNVNSTAVIIGAMLISPLMGPIIGQGAAVAVWDVRLWIRSARNLAVAVVVSLLTSALYFLISPFSDPQSELIARTTPTLLDAIIAFTGGAVGALALARRERSNVVPGVAIATALMPPLCTAGYGLGTLQWQFLVGGFYLFFINAVCISISTVAVFRVLKFTTSDAAQQPRRGMRWVVIGVLLITVLPSIVVMVRLLQENLERQRVERFLNHLHEHWPATIFVPMTSEQEHHAHTVLGVIGDTLSAARVDSIKALYTADVPNGTLEIRQRRGIDAATRTQLSTEVRAQVEARLGTELRQRLEAQDSAISVLQRTVDSLLSAQPKRKR